MPLSAIHKCSGTNTWRIGKGKCRFKSRQAAINAFEEWIKTKSKDSFNELGQSVTMEDFEYAFKSIIDNKQTIDVIYNIKDLEDRIKENKKEN